jgi:hypothetical protein
VTDEAMREAWLVGFRYGVAMALGSIALCAKDARSVEETACLERLDRELRELRNHPPLASVPLGLGEPPPPSPSSSS